MTESILTTQYNERIAQITALLTDGSAPQNLSPLPGRVIQFYPGTSAAWDDCCSGQLSFNLVNLSPKLGKAQVNMRQPCAVDWWNVNVQVKILRCAHTVANDGSAPATGAISEDGQQAIDDMTAILTVLKNQEYVSNIGTWEPVGPEGGCHGGTWLFTMRLDGDPCF